MGRDYANGRIVADWYIAQSPFASPGAVNFLVFAPIFSIVSIAYLEAVPRLAPRGEHPLRTAPVPLPSEGEPKKKVTTNTTKASHPLASLALEFLNTIFYFAGFTAMAAFIARLEFCRGAICAAAQASAVVAAASFVAWTGTTALLAKDVLKGGLKGSSKDMAEAPGSGAGTSVGP